MSRKLSVLTKPAAPVTRAYVKYHADHPSRVFPDIELPPQDVVDMTERLMLRVQEGVLPRVSWEEYDSWIQHCITMRWWGKDNQLQLAAYTDTLGVSIWMNDQFGGPAELDKGKLAYWHVSRISRPLWNTDDYGKLAIYRLGRNQDPHTVHLRFYDTAFYGVERTDTRRHDWDPVPKLGELGADIIAVTRRHLTTMGIA